MKTIQSIILGAILLLSLTSCTKELFRIESENTPAGIFRHIWNDYKINYGLFSVKKLDWDSVYQAHRVQIHENTTTAQLYAQVVSILSLLNDRHITLYPASNPELPTWSVDLDSAGTYVLEDFNGEVIKNNYLTELKESSPVIQYGKLNDQIGYLHILHFNGSRKEYENGMDAALQDLASLQGMILDIRDNSGGFDPNAQYVAGRLAAKEMLYMTTRKKNGPGPNDFAETREWYVRPTGRQQFTKPIIVLTTATTASAAETFLLALRTQDHIRHMGTPTAGSFSDNPSWEAPNGWMYTISVGDFRAADGSSYEGIGISPEILFPSQREDWVAGKDRVLEKALDLFF